MHILCIQVFHFNHKNKVNCSCMYSWLPLEFTFIYLKQNVHKKFWFDADAQAVLMEKCVKIVPTSAVIWVHVWMVHLVQRVSTLLPSAHVLIIVRVSSLSTSVQNQTNGCVIVNYKTKNTFLFIAWKFAIKWERPIFIAWNLKLNEKD